MARQEDKKNKKWHLFLKLGLLGGLSCLLTFFVYANSFELLFNKDLVFATSIKTFPNTQLLNSLIYPLTNTGVRSATYEGEFGQPKEIRIPEQNIRIQVIPSLKENNNFLARANTAQYGFRSQNMDGKLGNITFYLTKNWRTLDNPATINTQDNVFIDTDKDWRYMYRILEKKVISQNSSYVPTTSPLPNLILCVDDGKKSEYIFYAEFVTLQNIGR